MLRTSLLLALLAGSALPALAALPPQYQRQREIEAVLEAAVAALGVAAPVDRIERTGTDAWLVTGGRCRVVVTVVDGPATRPPGTPGPREFHAVAAPVACD